jgi:hypothetical protein
MLDGVIALGGLSVSELDNVPGLVRAILGNQAQGLTGFFGLRRMTGNIVEKFVKEANQLFSIDHSRVLGPGVVVDDQLVRGEQTGGGLVLIA